MADIYLPSSYGGAGLTLSNFRRDNRGGAQFDIVVTSRGFNGRSNYALEPEEFFSLLSDLERMYSSCSGSAEMRFHHEEEHVAFQLDTLGRLLVNGVLVQLEYPPQRLEFAFQSDQSCLPNFIEALSSR